MQPEQFVSVVRQVEQGLVQVQVPLLRTLPAMQLVQVAGLPEQVAQGLVQGVQV